MGRDVEKGRCMEVKTVHVAFIMRGGLRFRHG